MKNTAEGVVLWYDPHGSEVSQRETFTCAHDQRVGIVGVDDGGWCYREQKLLCKNPKCYEDCDPVLDRLGFG